MQSYESIRKQAEKRYKTKSLPDLPKPKSARALKGVGDDRYLAEMTRGVFCAGFVWKVIEAKWDGFEEAFVGFDPGYWVNPPRKHLAMLSEDVRIVRNRQKIETVPKNAAYITDVQKSHGNFGTYLAKWPTSDLAGLFAEMKSRGGRLGGMTAQYFLRRMGKDTYMVTRSTLSALFHAGVISAPKATSKRDQAAVQDAFNAWHEESGRPYCEMSRVLALSVPD